MTFGGQTVVLVLKSRSGAKDRFGQAGIQRQLLPVPGCRFRPVSVTEQETLTDVATGVWKATLPPVSGALSVQADDELLFDGTPTPADTAANLFFVDGTIMPKYDSDGALHHITIMCRRQTA